MRAAPIVVLFVALLAPGQARAVAPVAVQPAQCGDAEALLKAARETFRARPRPPFTVYTISRRDTINGTPVFDYIYKMRIWYRAEDGKALRRRVEDGSARGAIFFERTRFNAALDPGPPNADIFERAPPRPSPHATEAPVPRDDLREIGTITAPIELDYRARIVSCDPVAVHLQLEPRRDPDRNRLRDLWIDRATLSITRFVATDRMYEGLGDIWEPDVFDVSLAKQGDVPVIRSIHSTVDKPGMDEESEFTFDAISFPATLPDWYFDPSTYREHFADAPAW